jgi:hypothetical protein
MNGFFADHYLQQGVVLGSNFFLADHYWPVIISSRELCFGTIFFAEHGVFCGRIFLGPTGQEAKEKTVIIYGIAVTASQFLVIVYFR